MYPKIGTGQKDTGRIENLDKNRGYDEKKDRRLGNLSAVKGWFLPSFGLGTNEPPLLRVSSFIERDHTEI